MNAATETAETIKITETGTGITGTTAAMAGTLLHWRAGGDDSKSTEALTLGRVGARTGEVTS